MLSPHTQMANFEKVSYDQFAKDVRTYNQSHIDIEQTSLYEIWENLKPPQRSTSGSAGYDFFMPFDLYMYFPDWAVIPTGYKVRLNQDTFLMLTPRSGLSIQTGITLLNTVGIIDSDYYGNRGNEGHIMIALSNSNQAKHKEVEIPQGKAFAQGIILPYGIALNDMHTQMVKRTGGFGSTDKEGEPNEQINKG